MTSGEIAAALRGVGIERGDCVLVHSSLSSLGWVEGGAEAVVDALLQAVAANGTVLFPTLTGCPDDSPENPPVFDAANSRCWTGTIPETARRRTDGIRSLHPTHSVTAFGALSRWVSSGHELVRTPCGFGSPYDRLASIGGKIVLIGVTQSANTSFHHAEELAEVPYVVQPVPADITLVDASGEEIEMRGTYLHLWGPKRDYDVLESAMLELGICRIGQVGEARVRVVDTALQRMFLVRKLLEDPLAVLDVSERAAWMPK